MTMPSPTAPATSRRTRRRPAGRSTEMWMMLFACGIVAFAFANVVASLKDQHPSTIVEYMVAFLVIVFGAHLAVRALGAVRRPAAAATDRHCAQRPWHRDDLPAQPGRARRQPERERPADLDAQPQRDDHADHLLGDRRRRPRGVPSGHQGHQDPAALHVHIRPGRPLPHRGSPRSCRQASAAWPGPAPRSRSALAGSPSSRETSGSCCSPPLSPATWWSTAGSCRC